MNRHGHRLGNRPARRRIPAILAVAACMAAVGGVLLWRMSWMPPSWWVDPVRDDAQAAALAERVEYRLAEEAHKVREDPVFRLRITQEQVNAWLATRLPDWIAHASGEPWPRQLGPPQVRFAEGAVSVGIDVEMEGRRRVVVADFRPRIAGGKLEIPVEYVGMGRLRIPGGSVAALLDRLRAPLPAQLAGNELVGEVSEVLLGRRKLDPVVRLQDGRTVELLEVSCEEGAIVVRCRTN